MSLLNHVYRSHYNYLRYLLLSAVSYFYHSQYHLQNSAEPDAFLFVYHLDLPIYHHECSREQDFWSQLCGIQAIQEYRIDSTNYIRFLYVKMPKILLPSIDLTL